MTGLFGGTFNPPHIGHMILAERSLHEFSLDKIIFIPSGIPPHKSRNLLGCETRYKLTVLATCGNQRFGVSDYETKKTSVSYTIDTLRHFNRILHGEMIFLLGMDSLNDLKNWKDSDDIIPWVCGAGRALRRLTLFLITRKFAASTRLKSRCRRRKFVKI